MAKGCVQVQQAGAGLHDREPAPQEGEPAQARGIRAEPRGLAGLAAEASRDLAREMQGE